MNGYRLLGIGLVIALLNFIVFIPAIQENSSGSFLDNVKLGIGNVFSWLKEGSLTGLVWYDEGDITQHATWNINCAVGDQVNFSNVDNTLNACFSGFPANCPGTCNPDYTMNVSCLTIDPDCFFSVTDFSIGGGHTIHLNIAGSGPSTNTAPMPISYSPVNNSQFNNTNTIPFNLTAIDNESAVFNCSLYVDGQQIFQNLSYQNNTFLILNVSVAYGNHSFKFNCSDNESAVGNLTYLFSVNDTIPPNISFVDPEDNPFFATPNPVDVYGTVRLSAIVDDNVNVSSVCFNISNTYYACNASENITNTGTLYYTDWNTTGLGQFNYTIWANDTWGNTNQTTGNFTVNDSLAPEMFNLLATPYIGSLGGTVTLSVNATDNYLLDDVWTEIIWPDLTTTIVSLTCTGTYCTNTLVSNQRGRYEAIFYANDSTGNLNNMSNFPQIFFVPPIIFTDFNIYRPNRVVKIHGYGFSALSPVEVNITNSTNKNISGFPIDVVTDAFGNFDTTWNIPREQASGNYTIYGRDTVFAVTVNKRIEVVTYLQTYDNNTIVIPMDYKQDSNVNSFKYLWAYGLVWRMLNKSWPVDWVFTPPCYALNTTNYKTGAKFNENYCNGFFLIPDNDTTTPDNEALEYLKELIATNPYNLVTIHNLTYAAKIPDNKITFLRQAPKVGLFAKGEEIIDQTLRESRIPYNLMNNANVIANLTVSNYDIFLVGHYQWQLYDNAANRTAVYNALNNFVQSSGDIHSECVSATDIDGTTDWINIASGNNIRGNIRILLEGNQLTQTHSKTFPNVDGLVPVLNKAAAYTPYNVLAVDDNYNTNTNQVKVISKDIAKGFISMAGGHLGEVNYSCSCTDDCRSCVLRNNFAIARNRIIDNALFFGAYINDRVPPTMLSISPMPATLLPVNWRLNLTADVTDNAQVDRVWADVTMPDATTTRVYLTGPDLDFNYTYEWTNTPLIGIYNVTFFANDTNDNRANGTSYFEVYNIEVSNLTITPNITTVNNNITIRVNVTARVNIDTVLANITNTSGETTTIQLYNQSDYYNNTYEILTFAPGVYAVRIIANDTNNLINDTVTNTFQIIDLAPVGIWLNITPKIINQTQCTNITANASDDIAVDVGIANVTRPDGITISYIMTKTGNIFNYTYCTNLYSQINTYNVRFIVNDTNNNVNDSLNDTFVVNDVTPPWFANETVQVGAVANITSNVNDNINLNRTWINVTRPDSTTQILIPTQDGTYINATFIPTITGKYNITIFANDSSNNINTTNLSFTISDYVRVINVNATPNSSSPNTNITIFANITSPTPIDSVFANITYPNGTSVLLPMTNVSDIYNTTIEIGKIIGNLTGRIIANNTNGLVNDTQNVTFELIDTLPPVGVWLNVTPKVINQSQCVNITANVSDNMYPDVGIANITDANGTTISAIMTKNDTVFNYTYCTANNSPAGLYPVRFIVNDTSNNINDSMNDSFTVIDVTYPIEIWLNVTPSIINQTQCVNITANISENYVVDTAKINITYPNGSTYALIMTNNQPLFNKTFCTDLYHPITTYNIRLIANDTSNNINDSLTDSFNVNDVTPPWFANESTNGGTTPGSIKTLTTNVNDNIQTNITWFNITFPNGTTTLVWATLINTTMNATFNETNEIGTYFVESFANDTSNNLNHTMTTSFGISAGGGLGGGGGGGGGNNPSKQPPATPPPVTPPIVAPPIVTPPVVTPVYEPPHIEAPTPTNEYYNRIPEEKRAKGGRELNETASDVVRNIIEFQNPGLPQKVFDSYVNDFMYKLAKSKDKFSVNKAMYYDPNTNKTRIQLVIVPNGNQNISLYQRIPVCLAAFMNQIAFKNTNFTILDNDPLVVWNFGGVNTPTDVSFEVLGKVPKECYDIIMTLGIAQEFNQNTCGKFTLNFSLLLVLIVCGAIYLLTKKGRKKEDKETAKYSHHLSHDKHKKETRMHYLKIIFEILALALILGVIIYILLLLNWTCFDFKIWLPIIILIIVILIIMFAGRRKEVAPVHHTKHNK